MATMLPPDKAVTRSVITSPMPVNVMVPTMMPAVAVAMATVTMLRAPAASPSIRSCTPCQADATLVGSPRNQARSGRWVSTMKARNRVAQNAARIGESCSITRFHTKAPTGSTKYMPERRVGPMSGMRVIGTSAVSTTPAWGALARSSST